jgi:hypothetical protein
VEVGRPASVRTLVSLVLRVRSTCVPIAPVWTWRLTSRSSGPRLPQFILPGTNTLSAAAAAAELGRSAMSE